MENRMSLLQCQHQNRDYCGQNRVINSTIELIVTLVNSWMNQDTQGTSLTRGLSTSSEMPRADRFLNHSAQAPHTDLCMSYEESPAITIKRSESCF